MSDEQVEAGNAEVGEHSMDEGQTASVPAGDAELTAEVRQMAMFCHLAAFLGFVIPLFGCIIGPVLVWIMKKEQHSFIDSHGKESINFQITAIIAGAIGGIVVGILFFVFALIPFIGIILIGLLGLACLVVGILYIFLLVKAALAANEGRDYQYPFSIKLLA